MWDSDENRFAVLELVHEGRLTRREGQRKAWEWLAQLRWTKATGRRDELALAAGMQSEVGEMLDRRWPEWRAAQARLVESGLPVTHEGWKALQDAERAGRVGALPKRLNEKTAAACGRPALQGGPHRRAQNGLSRESNSHATGLRGFARTGG